MTNTESTLHKLPKDKLAVALKPHYDDFYSQLSESQKKEITFEQVVDVLLIPSRTGGQAHMAG